MTDELRQEVVRILSGWQPEPETTGAEKRAEAARVPRQAGTLPVQPAAAIEEINAQTDATADDDRCRAQISRRRIKLN